MCGPKHVGGPNAKYVERRKVTSLTKRKDRTKNLETSRFLIVQRKGSCAASCYSEANRPCSNPNFVPHPSPLNDILLSAPLHASIEFLVNDKSVHLQLRSSR